MATDGAAAAAGNVERFSLASVGTGLVSGESRWLASACSALPGWRAVEKYPERSPLTIADFLSPRVKGKRLCEIGTRNGDIMSCLMHMRARPSNATAIEMDGRYCRKLRNRGLNIICSKVEQVPRESLTSACDVYFWWPMLAQQSQGWLDIVHAGLLGPARPLGRLPRRALRRARGGPARPLAAHAGSIPRADASAEGEE